ncbi:hypothetical protein [Promicromonospora umidemergens]|uniref:hypothetical protein n=1 Tax=Promicromonospora umidemergens TaxID=629679 RepID=UPI0020A29808|nr:hypothetical protein [Promicromonospora umidemergens]
MFGPEILARFLSIPSPKEDKYGQHWQYNSRSDRHSKVGCWGIAFDMLAQSGLMQQHATAGKIVLGVNHPMRDFKHNREKDLDLVIARPDQSRSGTKGTFRGLVTSLGIPLSAAEDALLQQLPDISIAPVGAVLVSLEAKAAMTAHVKAKPRLYDELNSSHSAIHGASSQALAIGYVQVNHSPEFYSSVINSPLLKHGLPTEITKHNQPKDTLEIIDKVSQLPRRVGKSGDGFDAIGITVLDMINDFKTPVKIVTGSPAPQPGSNFHYDGMIVRMANEYDATFAHI